MLLPCRCFIPVSAADDIELAVLVDVEGGGGQELRFGVDDVPAKREIIAQAGQGGGKQQYPGAEDEGEWSSTRRRAYTRKHGPLLGKGVSILLRAIRRQKVPGKQFVSASCYFPGRDGYFPLLFL